MIKEPLYHEAPPGRFGLPTWWFGAPAIAFLYAWLTPQFLPDLVTPPATLPGNLAAPLRWFVGLLLGVAVMSLVQLALWLRAQTRSVPWKSDE